jgi:nucleoside phosphorylase
VGDTGSELDEVLGGVLCVLGAIGAPVCLLLYIRPDSFLTFSAVILGGFLGGSAAGQLLYHGLPYAIGLAILWVLYCLYSRSWLPALFGLVPLAAAGMLLIVRVRIKRPDIDRVEKQRERSESTAAIPGGVIKSMGAPVDFVIITPLREERDAVLRKLKGWRKLPPRKEDIRVYFGAELPVEFSDGTKAKYKVIVVPLAEMGEREAANATGDALRLWRPRFVILVGIAGGLRMAGVKIGDILIATQVADYELQKLTADGSRIRWRVHPVNQQLLLAEQNFLGDRWVDRIEVSRPGPGVPKLKRGVICTGNKVIANNLAQEYHEVWERLIGVEMEAGGVAGAAFSSVDPPGFFMVRGVSDLADNEKDRADTLVWREYACDAAAAYTVSLLA